MSRLDKLLRPRGRYEDTLFCFAAAKRGWLQDEPVDRKICAPFIKRDPSHLSKSEYQIRDLFKQLLLRQCEQSGCRNKQDSAWPLQVRTLEG